MSLDVKSYIHSVKYDCNDHYSNSALIWLLDRGVDLSLHVTGWGPSLSVQMQSGPPSETDTVGAPA